MYPCYKCNKSFKDGDLLIKHLQLYHLIKKPSLDDPLQCKLPSCNQLFSAYCNFRKHIRKPHDIPFCETPIETAVESVPEKLNLSLNSFDFDFCFDELNDSHIQRIFNYFKENSFLFTLRLHEKSFLPRNEIVKVQSMVAELIAPIGSALYKAGTNAEALKKIQESIISFCANPFETIQSEHTFFKTLKMKKLFEDPKPYTISNVIAPTNKKGRASLLPNKVDIIMMPVVFQIKSFFELPNILKLTIQNQKFLEASNNFRNFVNTESWTKKLKNYKDDDIVIPFFLYFDDFQTNNPIGAHVSSICGCYYSFQLKVRSG